MVCYTLTKAVVIGYFLMANILSAIQIDKFIVPEVIASDCISAVLECIYSGAGNDVTVRWLLNGTQVYEWNEETGSKSSGVWMGRVDLSQKTSILPVQKQILRVTELTPDVSGDYTCVVQSHGKEVRLTKTMSVFSPEHDFELTYIRSTPDILNVKCMANHLYPQPDLTIEFNKITIPQQQQRIWRNASYYDVECTAAVMLVRDLSSAEIACRLNIPQMDYTVITKKIIDMGNTNSGTYILIGQTSLHITLIWICTFTLYLCVF